MDIRTIKNQATTTLKKIAQLAATAALYSSDHPHLQEQLQDAYDALETLLNILPVWNIDIRDGLFLMEGIPLYELKLQTEKLIQLLAGRNIRHIRIQQGISRQQMQLFIQLLTEKNLDSEPVQMESALRNIGITAISVDTQPRPTDSTGAETELPAPTQIYGGSVEANKLIYTALREKNPLPMDVVDNVAQNITNLITRDPGAGLTLANLRSYDEYTFTHSANVAILSVATASSLIEDPEVLQQLARAAILHDVGKTKIPVTIVNKPGKLNEDEWRIMQQHPVLGAAVLSSHPNIDKLSMLIAFQHHMKYDGSGYPRVDGMSDTCPLALHPLALIVNICDIYDAITSRRPYKEPMPSDKALSIMMRLIGCDFDPQLFKLFVQMMGIYPPGCFVRLNTGEIAITRKARPTMLLMPEVSVITDSHGELLNEPLTVDLANPEENIRNRSVTGMVDAITEGLDPMSYI